jgi:hypothetical protein
MCVFDFLHKIFSAHNLIPRRTGRDEIQKYIYIQCVHKRTVQFQKLTTNLFLTLHGHNVHRQQRQLSKFLMHYQQFARSEEHTSELQSPK